MLYDKNVATFMLQLCDDKNSRQTLSNHRPELYNFIKKETLAQVFFCEFCEISENTFSYKTPPVAASEVNVRPYLINISKTRGGFSLLNFNLFQQKFTIFTKKFHHRYFSGILNSCSIVLCGIVTTK